MSFVLPPIVRLAERMLADIEAAVSRFPRAHRYSFGDELRRQARFVLRTANRAWRDKAARAEWLGQLTWAVDDLKAEIQIGQRLRAFRSVGQFEALARLAKELGKQVGGWNRQHHPQGQNAAPTRRPQRSQILSTPAASIREANR